MVIELKKSKITKNIVNQCLTASYSNYYSLNPNYKVLGWCMYVAGKRKVRFILLYNEKTNQILRLPYITKQSHIELIHESVQRSDNKDGWFFPIVYKLKVWWEDFSNATVIKEQTEETDEEMKILYRNTIQLFNEVNLRGQIYL